MNKSKRQKLSKEIHNTAVEKGFWDSKRNIEELYMLIVTELAEAVEAHRKGRWADKDLFDLEIHKEGVEFYQLFESCIRGTIEEELADAWIRCMDYLYYRHRDYIIMSEFDIDWSDNFAENIFTITKLFTDRRIKNGAYAIESLCEELDIDLEWFVENKMKYNSTREKLHGKKY